MQHTNKQQTLSLLSALALTVSTATCDTNVLLDNFNDANFAGWTVNTGTWTVTNGTLLGHGAGNGLDAWIYAGDTNWSDFVYEADAIFQSGNAEFVFRSTGHWTNEYRLLLWSRVTASASNCFELWEYNGGVRTIHADRTMSPVPITDVSHVRIEAIGSLLSFYINDGLMYQFDDPTPLQNGRIGLGTIWNWTDGFDNVSVTLVPEANVTWTLVTAGFLILVSRWIRYRRVQLRRPTARYGCGSTSVELSPPGSLPDRFRRKAPSLSDRIG